MIGDIYDERSLYRYYDTKGKKTMEELKITYGTDVARFVEDLYYGEIRPCEECGLLSDKIKVAEAELSAAKEKLIAEFPEITELWEKVQSLQSKVDSVYMVNEFGKGLALGIRLMQIGKERS